MTGALQQAKPIQWSGPAPWRLTLVCLTSALLGFLTLGMYTFWGRAEIRRRIWSSVTVLGEPLTYTGTGGELLRSFLIALAVVTLPVTVATLAIFIALGPQSPLLPLWNVALGVAFAWLLGFALYSSRRFRLSRTAWRGVRPRMTGKARSYANLGFWTTFLVTLTLGWMSPWQAKRLHNRLTNETAFGSIGFSHDMAVKHGLYGRFALLWFAGVLGYAAAIGVPIALMVMSPEFRTVNNEAAAQMAGRLFMERHAVLIGSIGFCVAAVIGVALAAYRAKVIRALTDSTRFGAVEFRSSVTTGGLIWLWFSNLVIVTFTLTLLRPVAQARRIRYLVNNLSVVGDLEAEVSLAEATAAAGGSEALGALFDVDIF